MTLQKARNAVLTMKTNFAYEVKRKEKDVERIMERWNKITQEQAKLGAVGTGMDCPNLVVVEGGGVPPVSLLPFNLIFGQPKRTSLQTDPLLEKALEESESARSLLLDENDAFRDVVLSAARGLSSLLYDLSPSTSATSPPPLLSAATFYSSSSSTSSAVASLYDASSHALNAHAKLKEMIASIRTTVQSIQSTSGPALKEAERKLAEEQEEKRALQRELDRVRAVVGDLRDELCKSGAFLRSDTQADSSNSLHSLARKAEAGAEGLAAQQRELIENLMADERFQRKQPDPEDECVSKLDELEMLDLIAF